MVDMPLLYHGQGNKKTGASFPGLFGDKTIGRGHPLTNLYGIKTSNNILQGTGSFMAGPMKKPDIRAIKYDPEVRFFPSTSIESMHSVFLSSDIHGYAHFGRLLFQTRCCGSL